MRSSGTPTIFGNLYAGYQQGGVVLRIEGGCRQALQVSEPGVQPLHQGTVLLVQMLEGVPLVLGETFSASADADSPRPSLSADATSLPARLPSKSTEHRDRHQRLTSRDRQPRDTAASMATMCDIWTN